LKRVASLVLALAFAGCGERAAQQARRERLAVERRGLDESLAQIEERMLADQARVRFWQEMRERHESASAIACTSLSRHAEAMAFLAEKQRDKRDALARRHRVAARFVPSADVAHGAGLDER
jgi:hypothetical protein